ncbi:hypothetical protein BDW62DRAFT_218367 [Aspergillus aurantiobrunneus]
MRGFSLLSSILLLVSSAAAKSTMVGIETETESRGVSVLMDDCQTIDEYEVYTVAITKKCRLFTAALTPNEQQGYIDAVWCLRSLPSALPNEEYPGVQDRFDDFAATHINYTAVIHRNGVLLPWHRHYLYLWETALRDECGYNGTVPYWDWTQNSDLLTNPIFNTAQDPAISLTLSGDGAYNETALALTTPTDPPLPPGNGGGCVLTGPFADWPVNMGPFSADQVYPYAPPPENAFAYHPHCLQRNLQSAVVQYFNNETVVDALLTAPAMDAFLDLLDRRDGGLGAHGAGHNAVGPVMQDVFASPQDPVFMLHHGMIDRVWADWQRPAGFDGGVDGARLTALNGTGVFLNPPDAPLVTLDTVIEFGVLDRPRRIGELMDVRGGRYCYRYEE